MDEASRLHYLQAMGIDVWVTRHQSAATLQTFSDQDSAVAAEPNRTDLSASLPGGLDTPTQQTPHAELTDDYRTPPPAHPASHTDTASWQNLQYEVSQCRACPLCETRTQTVFGVGDNHADWLLIGEAPGQNEDLQGEPFVGVAGQLLNEMLRAIGLQRQQVYIANILKCRPPGNRDPQAEEITACHTFLQRQIQLIQPKIILAVGRVAAQNLLKTQQPLARLRGVRHELDGIPLTVVHHPAYLLRALPEKAKAWEDLQFALSVYHQTLEH